MSFITERFALLLRTQKESQLARFCIIPFVLYEVLFEKKDIKYPLYIPSAILIIPI